MIGELLTQNWLAQAISMAIGKWAKNQTWIGNWLVPALVFVTNVFVLALAPAPVQAAELLVPSAPVVGLFAQALLNQLVVTGVHSTFKNTVIPALKWTGVQVAKVVLGKLSPEVK